MKNLLLSFSAGCLLLFAFISCSEGTSKELSYDLKPDESAFVILQIKEDVIELDSSGRSVLMREVIDKIKAANNRLGLAPFEKKMASTLLSPDDNQVHILAIRYFESLSAARIYADDLDRELKGVKYGSIPKPFAIAQSNFKQCMADADFTAYYKSYNQAL